MDILCFCWGISKRLVTRQESIVAKLKKIVQKPAERKFRPAVLVRLDKGDIHRLKVMAEKRLVSREKYMRDAVKAQLAGDEAADKLMGVKLVRARSKKAGISK